MNILPKIITTKFGLQDKLHELNQNMPMNLRFDGLHVEYNNGKGVVKNRRTGEVYGEYVQFNNYTYRLREVKK